MKKFNMSSNEIENERLIILCKEMKTEIKNQKERIIELEIKLNDLVCICENPNYDLWSDPSAIKVFDDEKGFCAICPICGMWNN